MLFHSGGNIVAPNMLIAVAFASGAHVLVNQLSGGGTNGNATRFVVQAGFNRVNERMRMADDSDILPQGYFRRHWDDDTDVIAPLPFQSAAVSSEIVSQAVNRRAIF